MRTIRTVLLAVVATTVFVVAGTASANNKVPLAPDSQAFAEGGVAASDGSTPQVGEMLGAFQKGNESYNGSSTTTVVDFTLPAGVSILNDAGECGSLPNNDCLVVVENTCADPTGVTINGNEIEFQIACDPGETFVWAALINSLLPAGSYDASVQFKVGTYRRVASGPNMWQIPIADALTVDAA